MIAIIDYGLGNTRAFLNIYKSLNIPAAIVSDVRKLESVEKIILPGVGAFDHSIEKLNSSGMRDKIETLVMVEEVPFLGVCVGMQLLAETSEEGKSSGLGWIKGEVKMFNTNLEIPDYYIPHMGWNNVNKEQEVKIFRNILDPEFYFLHSYFFQPKSMHSVIGTTNFGINFVSAIAEKNIFGVQFHPEKSHAYGISLLKNFADL